MNILILYEPSKARAFDTLSEKLMGQFEDDKRNGRGTLIGSNGEQYQMMFS